MKTSNGVYFFTENVKFNLKNKVRLRKWLVSCIENEGKTAGVICYTFCSDRHLLELNNRHLGHDFFTDVLTFDYSDNEGQKRILSGDILISIDRVRENAILMKNSFQKELSRIMIHGILHLAGYKDKSNSDKKNMEKKENYYLKKIILFFFIITFSVCTAQKGPAVMPDTGKTILICKSWKMVSIEEFATVAKPGEKQKNDGLTCRPDGSATLTLDGEVKQGKWSFDKSKSALTVETRNTGEKRRFRILTLSRDKFVCEYQDPELIRIKYTFEPQ